MNKERLVNNFNLVKVLDYVIVGCLGLILAYSIFSKRLLKVCFVVAVLAWSLKQVLCYKKKFYKYFIPKTFLNKAIGFFVLATFLSVLFSIDFKYSQRVFFERYLPFIMFFFIAAGLAKENLKYIKWLIGIFLLSGFVIGMGGVWDYFTVVRPARLFSSFGKEHFGLYSYSVLITPLATVLLLFGKSKILKIIAGLSSLVAIPCLVWNFYRGAIIAFFVSIIIVSFFRNKKLTIGIILIFLIASFYFLPNRYLDRMSTTVNPATWGDRIPMWKSAISMWQDYPVFGVGVREYKDLMFEYEPSPNSIKRKHDHAHNTYFQILAEGGIIGLWTFLYIFFVFFKNIWVKRYKIIYSEEFGIIGGVIAVIIACLIFSMAEVLFILRPISASLWLIFGLGVGRLEVLLK